ncbi:MAG TPA: ABC transporter permease [Chitinophagaceae bacterium]|nr:ABC transporter permease [Chitinophagaceae bacterium]
MMNKYLKIAWRGIVGRKLYNTINIAGLSVAIAVVLLIFTYVFSEKSFDRQNAAFVKSYRVIEYLHYPGAQPQLSATASFPILPLLKSTHPEIQDFARVMPVAPYVYTSAKMVYNNSNFNIDHFVCADSSFPNIFTVQWVAGGNAGFLQQPNTVVLNESTATRIFGTAAGGINKTLKIDAGDTSFNVTVSGIIKDFPYTSHLQVNAFMAYPRPFQEGLGSNWGALLGPAYLTLKQGVDAEKLAGDLTKIVHTKNQYVDIRLQPMSDIHLGSSDIIYDDFNFKKSEKKYLAIFSMVALFVLLIAGMNFVNLTMSVAGFRGKEIAVKKIAGAGKKTLFIQVLTESFLSVALATVIGVCIETAVLPYMNILLDRNLDVSNMLGSANYIGLLAGILVIIPLVAGFFPSYAISRININKALKSKVLFGNRATLRGILVTVQFAIAIVLVAGIIVIAKQLDFINKTDLGYKYDQVISIPMGFAEAGKYDALESELNKLNHVKNVSFSREALGTDAGLYGVKYKDAEGKEQFVSMNTANIGPNYIPLFDMKMVAGRNFSQQSHDKEYIINESFAKQVGWKNPIGQSIVLTSWQPGTIVGVVKDFNFNSLHHKIEPLVISCINSPYFMQNLYIKVTPGDVANTIAQIKDTWQHVTGNNGMEYNFLDEHFKQVYKADRQGAAIITILGVVAIFIACLGLFGLTTHAIQKRVKEISVRKVLGANVSSIVALLSKDFFKFIAVAAVVAFPVAWVVMNKWLNNFAYRITISWWILAVAGISSLLIALATISIQAVKAATANPVNNLKAE